MSIYNTITVTFRHKEAKEKEKKKEYKIESKGREMCHHSMAHFANLP